LLLTASSFLFSRYVVVPSCCFMSLRRESLLITSFVIAGFRCFVISSCCFRFAVTIADRFVISHCCLIVSRHCFAITCCWLRHRFVAASIDESHCLVFSLLLAASSFLVDASRCFVVTSCWLLRSFL
jgi:hypothetical protein